MFIPQASGGDKIQEYFFADRRFRLPSYGLWYSCGFLGHLNARGKELPKDLDAKLFAGDGNTRGVKLVADISMALQLNHKSFLQHAILMLKWLVRQTDVAPLP